MLEKLDELCPGFNPTEKLVFYSIESFIFEGLSSFRSLNLLLVRRLRTLPQVNRGRNVRTRVGHLRCRRQQQQ